MREFIKKKREMFIVAMLIKEKEEEIQKLVAECNAEQKQLKQDFAKLQQEQAIHEKENEQAHLFQQEQSRLAEMRADEQSKKTQEIKQLEQQIEKIKEDITKAKVSLFYSQYFYLCY